METTKKPGWEYIYSETLEQRVAYHLATGWLFCSDGTKYSPHELSLLRNVKLPKCVHDVKKACEGTIVEIKEKESNQPEKESPVIHTAAKTHDEQGRLFIW